MQAFTVKRACVFNPANLPLILQSCQKATLEIRYQTPYPAPAINPTITNANNAINSLNFRYRLRSGGASEPCGKYGGGV